jgi:hypothetical protein
MKVLIYKNSSVQLTFKSLVCTFQNITFHGLPASPYDEVVSIIKSSEKPIVEGAEIIGKGTIGRSGALNSTVLGKEKSFGQLLRSWQKDCNKPTFRYTLSPTFGRFLPLSIKFAFKILFVVQTQL